MCHVHACVYVRTFLGLELRQRYCLLSPRRAEEPQHARAPRAWTAITAVTTDLKAQYIITNSKSYLGAALLEGGSCFPWKRTLPTLVAELPRPEVPPRG